MTSSPVPKPTPLAEGCLKVFCLAKVQVTPRFFSAFYRLYERHRHKCDFSGHLIQCYLSDRRDIIFMELKKKKTAYLQTFFQHGFFFFHFFCRISQAVNSLWGQNWLIPPLVLLQAAPRRTFTINRKAVSAAAHQITHLACPWSPIQKDTAWSTKRLFKCIKPWHPPQHKQ